MSSPVAFDYRNGCSRFLLSVHVYEAAAKRVSEISFPCARLSRQFELASAAKEVAFSSVVVRIVASR
jgi:hypothetical protein